MTTEIAFTQIDCPACGMLFFVTKAFEGRRRDDGKAFYCPSGHVMDYKPEKKAGKK